MPVSANAPRIRRRPPLPLAGRTTLTLAQRVAHGCLLVLGWVGFVVMWWKVAVRPWESADLVVLIVGSLVLLPSVTLLWVGHNLGIHRRKGPRRHSEQLPVDYRTDWNGHPVSADWAALRHARVVVIDIDDQGKHYRAVGER